MTDKFPMHSDFPMDEAYKAKAAERGFAPDRAVWLFERWREYWIGRTDTERTPRGWAQCWDNDLKSKARNGARNSKGGRFERYSKEPGPLPNRDINRRWIGGRAYEYPDFLAIRQRARAGMAISDEERQVMKAWEAK